MTVIKEYNTSTGLWEPIVSGVQGPAGPTGPAGAAGDWSSAQTVNPVTTGPYTVLNSDAGKVVCWSGSGATTFTIDTATSLAVGQKIDFINLTTGVLTFAGSGVTLSGTPGLKTRAQYSAATLICVISGIYVLIGDLTV